MKFYDKLAEIYDYFIDWPERIKKEDAFFQHIFRERMGMSILDVGCGTGGHSLHWGDVGYNVIGIDSSSEMIQYAQRMAEEREIDTEFQCMKMTDFSNKLQVQFDTIVCVGNTLAHLIEKETMLRFFQECISSMKITSAAVFHILNYDLILENKRRDFPVKSYKEGDHEYVFMRFYDYLSTHLEFNMIYAIKDEKGWHSKSMQMMHRPWRKEELLELMKEAGFTHIMCYGGYDFSEFNPNKSTDLVFVCELGDTE